MTSVTFLRTAALTILACSPAFADSKSAKTSPISHQTRLEIVRALSAEFAFARKPLPPGEKVILIKPDGRLAPSDNELRQLVAQRGQVARAGERVQITALEFKGKTILVEVNGGPVKKPKWYQRLEIGGNGGSRPITSGPDPNAKGLSLVLEYNDYIPEMTAAQLRERLQPLFDFSVKSAAQAYTETLPKNVQDAIRDQRVLVGMTKEMVTYAKGRPPQRLREKDENNNDYEEWIFGQPPSDVEFVRFVGDEVVQLKIMKVNGEKMVKTEKEVHLEQSVVAEAQPELAPTLTPTLTPGSKAPTLRRPGEAVPVSGIGSPNPGRSPQSSSPAKNPSDPPDPVGDPRD